MGIGSANTDPLGMHVEHDAVGLGGRFVEYRLENLHNEFHGGVIVVVHQHPEQGRLPGAHRALLFGSGFVDSLLVAHCLMVL